MSWTDVAMGAAYLVFWAFVLWRTAVMTQSDTQGGPRYCEARIPDVCTGQAQHRHHRKLRAQGGDNSPENLLGICLHCHDWAHRHPKEAHDLGLIVLSWENPADVPVSGRIRA